MKRRISYLLIVAIILMTVPMEAWAATDDGVTASETEVTEVSSDSDSENSVAVEGDSTPAESDLTELEDIAENIAEDIDLSPSVDEDIVESDVAAQVDDNTEVSSAEADSLPSSVDLRDSGLISQVEDQGSTNACWAFAPLASAESTAAADTGMTYDFSELYAVAYANSLHDGEGMQVTSDGELVNPFYAIGDNGEYVASRMTAWSGPADENMISEQYPSYDDASEASIGGLDEGDESVMAGVHVQNVEYLPSPAKRTSTDGNSFAYAGYNEAGTQAIKQAVADNAAVMILLKAPELQDADYVNYTNNAMYVSDENTKLDHAVTIVGYDDDYSRDNFSTTPEGDGAWICKNSWGTIDNYIDQFKDQIADEDTRTRALKAYGTANPELTDEELDEVTDDDLAGWLYDMMMPIDRDGYFYVSYYDKTLYHPTVYRAEQNDYNINHQYDQLGMLSPTTLAMSESSGTVANVFTASSAEELKAVSVYSSIPGCTAEITVCRVSDDGKPDTEDVIGTTSANLTWAGFHTVSLDQNISLSKGDTFAVVEKITTPAGKGYTPVEITKSEGDSDKLYEYVINENEEGQSFIMTGEEWTDLAEYDGFGYEAGNAMIKAYATAVEDESTDEDSSDFGDTEDLDQNDDEDSGDTEDLDQNDDEDSGDTDGNVNQDTEDSSGNDATGLNQNDDEDSDNTDIIAGQDADDSDEYVDEDEDAYYVESEATDDEEDEGVDSDEDAIEDGESQADSTEEVAQADSSAEVSSSNATSYDAGNNSPNTGDSSKIWIYSFGLIGAVIILVVVVYLRRKNK